MNICLITGANKGIGFEVARLIGGTVLVGARDEERGRAAESRLRAEGVDARFVRLDVTDLDTIDAAAKWIDAEYGRLDVLVNNAGIAGTPGSVPPSEVPVETVRTVYETNVFGVVAVTNAMLPLLRRATAARIVNVSSELGSLTQRTDPASPISGVNLLAYDSAKSALNAITVCYAQELRDTPIKINAVTPGHCATDLNDHSGLLSPEEGAVPIVRAALMDDDGPSGTFSGAGGPIPW